MANDYYKTIVEWSLANGSVAQNIHYHVITGGDVADDANLVQDIADYISGVYSTWVSFVNQNVVLERVLVYEFDKALNQSTPRGTAVIGTAGSSTSGSMPSGCAIKVNQFVATRTRPAGMYLVPPAIGAITQQGTVTAACAAAGLAVGVAGSTIHITGNLGLQLLPLYYSVKDGDTVGLNGASVQVDTTVDYMRSRKAGNGI